MPKDAKKIQEVDQYIEKAAPFAQPILRKLRSWVHKYGKGMEEKIRWSYPHFDLEGRRICFMAAFKQHAAFGFIPAEQMNDPQLLAKARSEEAMGHLGKLVSVNDLPEESQFEQWIGMAIAVRKQPAVRKPKISKPAPEIPEDFGRILTEFPEAQHYFHSLSNSHRREYITHIEEAKKPETRIRRMEKTVQALLDAAVKKVR